MPKRSKKNLLIVPVGKGDRQAELVGRLRIACPRADIIAAHGFMDTLHKVGSKRFSAIVLISHERYSVRLAAFGITLERGGYKADDLFLWRAGEPRLVERSGFGNVFLHDEIDALTERIADKINSPDA